MADWSDIIHTDLEIDYLSKWNTLVTRCQALQTTIDTWTAPATVLKKLTGANLNTTADQAITGLPAKYVLMGIYATNCSGSATTAVGGIYTAASKGGSQVIYNGQSFAALTGSTVLLPMSFAAGAMEVAYTAETLYFSLTTPQGSAMTCDIHVIGVSLP